MSKVRDPEPQVDVKPVPAVTHPSLVSRALAPRRRVAGSELSRDEMALQASVPLGEPVAKRKFRPVRWSFALLVALPAAIFAAYLFGIASDQYVAEARFAVRPVDPDIGGFSTKGGITGNDDKSKSTSNSVSGASPLAGVPNLGSENAEIVANYIHSRSIVDDVSRTVDVRAIFRRPEADFYARLSKDASSEELAEYWNKMILVYIEASSGIVTLSVSAFRRQDALVLAEAILKSSDKLVNSLSAKVRADAIKTAENEVRRSDTEVRTALTNLTEFRNSNRLIDPVQTSEATGKLLLKVLSDKIETEARLYVAQRTQGPNAPGLGTIRARLDSINDQASRLQAQMAGDKQVSKNLAATLAEFEGFELKKQFAERMYGFARDGIERARIAAIRQSVYLAVFVPPSLPQDYTYPQRYTNLAIVGIALLMIWASGLTISASVLDHRL